MNYAEIKYCDIANGVGVRTSLFVSGCRNRCENCFNQVTWDFFYGSLFTDGVARQVLDSLKPDYIAGLSLLGGEPFEPENQEPLCAFLRRVKKEAPGKTIWCYTGFTLEELLGKVPCRAVTEHTAEFLSYLDVLVDGRYVEEKKDIRLRFRGSSNQRVIDMKKTLAAGEIHLFLE